MVANANEKSASAELRQARIPDIDNPDHEKRIQSIVKCRPRDGDTDNNLLWRTGLRRFFESLGIDLAAASVEVTGLAGLGGSPCSPIAGAGRPPETPGPPSY